MILHCSFFYGHAGVFLLWLTVSCITHDAVGLPAVRGEVGFMPYSTNSNFMNSILEKPKKMPLPLRIPTQKLLLNPQFSTDVKSTWLLTESTVNSAALLPFKWVTQVYTGICFRSVNMQNYPFVKSVAHCDYRGLFLMEEDVHHSSQLAGLHVVTKDEQRCPFCSPNLQRSKMTKVFWGKSNAALALGSKKLVKESDGAGL